MDTWHEWSLLSLAATGRRLGSHKSELVTLSPPLPGITRPRVFGAILHGLSAIFIAMRMSPLLSSIGGGPSVGNGAQEGLSTT